METRKQTKYKIMPEPRLLDKEQLAALLSFSVGWIDVQLADESSDLRQFVKPIYIGKKTVRFDRQDALNWIAYVKEKSRPDNRTTNSSF